MKKTVLILSLALGTIGVLGILYAKKLTTESSEKALKTEAESLSKTINELSKGKDERLKQLDRMGEP